MTQDKTIAVVAGNREEFFNFINNLPIDMTKCEFKIPYMSATINSDTQYRYITRTEDLRGRQFDDVMYYGTFYNRENINEIIDQIHYCLMFSRLSPKQQNLARRKQLIKAIKEL